MKNGFLILTCLLSIGLLHLLPQTSHAASQAIYYALVGEKGLGKIAFEEAVEQLQRKVATYTKDSASCIECFKRAHRKMASGISAEGPSYSTTVAIDKKSVTTTRIKRVAGDMPQVTLRQDDSGFILEHYIRSKSRATELTEGADTVKFKIDKEGNVTFVKAYKDTAKETATRILWGRRVGE